MRTSVVGAGAAGEDAAAAETNGSRGERAQVKCVVWDLDNTLWDGVLLEDGEVTLRPGVAEIVRALDARGILQSVASKNEYEAAAARLREFGLHDYFLYPQINWNSKVASIQNIARLINIGLDSIAFIDDQDFELAEVRFSLPELRLVNAAELDRLLEMPELNPRFITHDSTRRRQMYVSDIERNRAEEQFVGPREEFLATLGMKFDISEAREEDLRRAEELTVRTNQLNATGYTYSYEELDAFRRSPRHKLLITELEDKFGSYGKIGLALLECDDAVWTLKLLLMSCRVMSRGVGSVLLNHVMRLASERRVRLLAEFVSNERNRMMLVSYKFAGFREVKKEDNFILFEADLSKVQPPPAYIEISVEG